MAPNNDESGSADASTLLMTNMANSFALMNCISSIPTFDGRKNLREYIQDLRNAAGLVSEDIKPQFLQNALHKITGPAKKSLVNKTINNIEDLIKHLKQRFGPGRNFSYYNNKIQTVRMREHDTVGDFYDEINVLLGSATTTLKEEKGDQYSEEMMAPLKSLAVDIFIKGLPANLAERVDYSKPETLREAYEEAVRLETRMEAKIIPDSRPYRGRSQNYNNQRQYNGPRSRQDYDSNRRYEEEGPYRNRYQENPDYVGYMEERPQYEQYEEYEEYDEYEPYGEPDYVGYVQERPQNGPHNEYPDNRHQPSGYQQNNYRGNNYRGRGYQSNNSGRGYQNNYGQNNGRGQYNPNHNNGRPQGGNWQAWNSNGNRGHQRIFDHHTGRYENVQQRPDRRDGNNWRNEDPRYNSQNQQGNLNSQQARHDPRMASQNQNYQNQNQHYVNPGQQNQQAPRNMDQATYQKQMQEFNQNRNPNQSSPNENPPKAAVMAILTKPERSQGCAPLTVKDLKTIIGRTEKPQP